MEDKVKTKVADNKTFAETFAAMQQGKNKPTPEQLVAELSRQWVKELGLKKLSTTQEEVVVEAAKEVLDKVIKGEKVKSQYSMEWVKDTIVTSIKEASENTITFSNSDLLSRKIQGDMLTRLNQPALARMQAAPVRQGSATNDKISGYCASFSSDNLNALVKYIQKDIAKNKELIAPAKNLVDALTSFAKIAKASEKDRRAINVDDTKKQWIKEGIHAVETLYREYLQQNKSGQWIEKNLEEDGAKNDREQMIKNIDRATASIDKIAEVGKRRTAELTNTLKIEQEKLEKVNKKKKLDGKGSHTSVTVKHFSQALATLTKALNEPITTGEKAEAKKLVTICTEHARARNADTGTQGFEKSLVEKIGVAYQESLAYVKQKEGHRAERKHIKEVTREVLALVAKYQQKPVPQVAQTSAAESNELKRSCSTPVVSTKVASEQSGQFNHGSASHYGKQHQRRSNSHMIKDIIAKKETAADKADDNKTPHSPKRKRHSGGGADQLHSSKVLRTSTNGDISVKQ